MSRPLAFAVNWDYRCPYARNAHEHVIEGLRAGADWDVTFVAFSLNQVHVEEGGIPVWEDPEKRNTLLAIEAGIVVRDRMPEQFLAVHDALFAARHDEARDTREEGVVRGVLEEQGVDAGAVFAEIADGWPAKVFREEHERSVQERKAFGVPTFMQGDRAVFVRLMTRPRGDGALATATIEKVVDLLDGFPELNEFKYTSISR